jgi:hypothetical protein
MAALIAAGAIVGGGVALAVDHPSSSNSTSASSTGQGAGTAPGGSGFPGSTSDGSGAGGISPTAYRLSGTITAISGSTVTIKTSSGNKTYTVTSSTQLRRNGSTVALSSFQTGDSVVGSTTASGGSTLNDLMAGMGGGGAPAGTAPGSSSGASSGSSSGSTT